MPKSEGERNLAGKKKLRTISFEGFFEFFGRRLGGAARAWKNGQKTPVFTN